MQFPHKRPEQVTKSRGAITNDFRQAPTKLRDVAGSDDATLRKQTSDLIDEPHTITNEPLANPMDGLDCQLIGRLWFDKAHSWTLLHRSDNGLADRLRIILFDLTASQIAD